MASLFDKIWVPDNNALEKQKTEFTDLVANYYRNSTDQNFESIISFANSLSNESYQAILANFMNQINTTDNPNIQERLRNIKAMIEARRTWFDRSSFEQHKNLPLEITWGWLKWRTTKVNISLKKIDTSKVPNIKQLLWSKVNQIWVWNNYSVELDFWSYDTKKLQLFFSWDNVRITDEHWMAVSGYNVRRVWQMLVEKDFGAGNKMKYIQKEYEVKFQDYSFTFNLNH